MIHNSSKEKTVVLGPVTEEDAKRFSKSMDVPMVIDDEAIPRFEKRQFMSFQAEYTKRGDDIVIHFYLPLRANLNHPTERAAWLEYWTKQFPLKLEPVVREYFEADHPRLVAKYTEEATSWWFKAQGYGHVDLDPFVEKLLSLLEAALQESN